MRYDHLFDFTGFLPMRRFYFFILCFLLLNISHPIRVMAAGTAGGFAPHKALYDIRMSGAKSGSQIANVTGQMMYEWQPTCDAWQTKHKFNLTYEYADAPAMRIFSDFSTFEPFDGKSINFSSQRRQGSDLIEELRGQANLDGDNKGVAIYSRPEGLEFDLPPGAMFPMTHTANVLNAIKEGKKFYSAVVFDGSDQEGPVEISAFIGARVDGAAALKDIKGLDPALLQSSAHKVRLAFFPLNEPSESADYEMSAVFHENGVISDMVIEYDDFTVTQKLIALKPVAGTCPVDGAVKKPQ
jgi:hypothetical protein